MVLYALYHPVHGGQHSIQLFSTHALAEGAVALYGLKDTDIVPVELLAKEKDLLPWRWNGRPLHVHIALDAATGTRPAKAYTRSLPYADEVLRNEQRGDRQGLLDALRPSVEMGLPLWLVTMDRHGVLGPVLSALDCSVDTLQALPNNLLNPVLGAHRPSRGCTMQRQEDILLFVHARDVGHAAELATPRLQAWVKERQRNGTISLFG